MSKTRTLAGGRTAFGALFLGAAVAALASGARSAEGEGEQIEETRAALEKWVETRRVISKEKRDWALGREVLGERIARVKRELEALRARLTETEGSISEAEARRAELAAENDALKETSALLTEAVTALETRTAELLSRLPDPIRERVKPLSQQLPDDPADTPLSVGQRFQNVIGVLNAINKFHREITVTSEVRALADGSSAEVTAIYVGLGQGYYATANGLAAGIGTGTPEGWTWTPANASAPDIALAIAVLKNEDVAQFVRLPVRSE